MRVKTNARRKAIIDTAWAVFREFGFERTTMSQISERLGGSKATLYSYFNSKEELFAEALQHVMGETSEAAFEHLTGEGDLGERLAGLARTYLEARLSPDMISVERAMMAEADRSDLPRVMRAQFIAPHWRRLGDVLEQEMASGRLRPGPGYVAALHFRGLIEADIVERGMFGDGAVTADAIDYAVCEGVGAFLRAYAPE